MKNNSFLFFLFLISLQALAQRDGSIHGRLKDTAAAPVPDATITVLNAKDSSLVSFSRSLPSGAFLVRALG
ncbi:MAG TPA: carboxypeptidase-like regulatory domain-containing protein [Puia sp.]|nr:carboxypeptidase-like regulatory domain-containing protein [Puia sp.]